MNLSALFSLVFGIYALGWLVCCLSFFSNEKYGDKWGERLLLLGLAVQILYIGMDYLASGDFLFDSLSGLFLFLSFFTIAIFSILDKKFPNQIFKIIFPPVGIFFLVLSVTISDQAIVAKQFLDRSTTFGKFMLISHASCAMLGYLLFGVACLTSMFYLYQEDKIKSKKLLLQNVKVPSLGFLDKLNYKVITVGFLFLSVGILLGINMKIVASNGEIAFSLRQAFPVATWAIYALFLIDRFINGLRGKVTAMWSIVGFLAAITSFAYEVSLLIERS